MAHLPPPRGKELSAGIEEGLVLWGYGHGGAARLEAPYYAFTGLVFPICKVGLRAEGLHQPYRVVGSTWDSMHVKC